MSQENVISGHMRRELRRIGRALQKHEKAQDALLKQAFEFMGYEEPIGGFDQYLYRGDSDMKHIRSADYGQDLINYFEYKAQEALRETKIWLVKSDMRRFGLSVKDIAGQ